MNHWKRFALLAFVMWRQSTALLAADAQVLFDTANGLLIRTIPTTSSAEVAPGPLRFTEHYAPAPNQVKLGWSAPRGQRYDIFAQPPGASGFTKILDAVTHRPDLPLYPGGSTMIGFGLWNSVTATLLIEGAIFVIGVWLYLSGTQTNDKVGHYSLWVFLLLTIIMYVGNAVGPPPPDARTLAWFALGIWLIPLWAGWFDRHRRLTGA